MQLSAPRYFLGLISYALHLCMRDTAEGLSQEGDAVQTDYEGLRVCRSATCLSSYLQTHAFVYNLPCIVDDL